MLFYLYFSESGMTRIHTQSFQNVIALFKLSIHTRIMSLLEISICICKLPNITERHQNCLSNEFIQVEICKFYSLE